jgi:hypothetical protein
MLDVLKPKYKQNPFDTFLSNAASELQIALNLRSATGLDELQNFVTNQEELNFALDLCRRIQRLSAAFDLLCSLTDRMLSAREEDDRNRDSAGCYTMTEEIEQARTRIYIEAEMLTHYLYYELKSVTDMLRLWNIKVVAASELEYVLKARDRLLAHPEVFRIAPHPFRRSSYPLSGGFMEVGVGTPFPFEPFSKTYYSSKLGVDPNLNPTREEETNELILRSKAKNENLTDEEVTRIKLFGVREPNVLLALHEFAALLATSLTDIRRIASKAVNENGYERYVAAGPLQSHRVP